jgi:hypothetical protein
MNYGIKILGALIPFAILSCVDANDGNTNTVACVKAVIVGQNLFVMGKDNQLVITPLKNKEPVKILYPVQSSSSFFLPSCWDIVDDSLYLTHALEIAPVQFSVLLLKIPIASIQPYDGHDKHRSRIPKNEHRITRASILNGVYVMSQAYEEYKPTVADMHVAPNGIVTIMVQYNEKLYVSTFDLKDRKKDWKGVSVPIDRAPSPFVTVRGDRGVSIFSEDGRAYLFSGNEVSMVRKKPGGGEQSAQADVEPEVQIMVIDKRKPGIDCLRFGMRDKAIQFHHDGVERAASDAAGIDEISRALERAKSAMLKVKVNKEGK